MSDVGNLDETGKPLATIPTTCLGAGFHCLERLGLGDGVLRVLGGTNRSVSLVVVATADDPTSLAQLQGAAESVRVGSQHPRHCCWGAVQVSWRRCPSQGGWAERLRSWGDEEEEWVCLVGEEPSDWGS